LHGFLTAQSSMLFKRTFAEISEGVAALDSFTHTRHKKILSAIIVFYCVLSRTIRRILSFRTASPDRYRRLPPRLVAVRKDRLLCEICAICGQIHLGSLASWLFILSNQKCRHAVPFCGEPSFSEPCAKGRPLTDADILCQPPTFVNPDVNPRVRHLHLAVDPFSPRT
jgi:hypothetical protein